MYRFQRCLQVIEHKHRCFSFRGDGARIELLVQFQATSLPSERRNNRSIPSGYVRLQRSLQLLLQRSQLLPCLQSSRATSVGRDLFRLLEVSDASLMFQLPDRLCGRRSVGGVFQCSCEHCPALSAEPSQAAAGKGVATYTSRSAAPVRGWYRF